jgi:AcrR family transcriptional regulator
MKNNKNSEKSKDVQERLLKSALKLFSQKGYAASIREIAEDSGTTLPSIYYYFGNKEGLYVALLQKHLSAFDSVVKMEENDHDFSSVREKLKSFTMTTYMMIIGNLEFLRVTHAISYGPPEGAPPFNIEPYSRKFSDFITGLISTGIENGEFRSGNASHMAFLIQAASQHMLSKALFYGSSRFSHREEMEAILETILEGFQA